MIKKIKISILIAPLFLVLVSLSTPVSAQKQSCTESNLRAIGVALLNCSNPSSSCSVSGGSLTVNQEITWGEGVWGANSGIYQSGLGAGPYTLEQWAIHVLKNISIKTGIPEDQMVTEAKVVSLIAWSKAEGGGVDGHNGSFNPLNTKLAHADLNAVNQGDAANDRNSSGYPDFDTGVEAITRGLFNIYQKRIGSALLTPGLSDLDFIEAVAGDFVATNGGEPVINNLEDQFPGDKIFAAASIEGFIFSAEGQGFNGGVGSRQKYIESKRGALESVKENYAAQAGKLLDSYGKQPPPPGEAAPLIFSPNTATATTPHTGGACTRRAAGQGQGAVNADGYSFPLAPQTKQISGLSGIHHDGTPAFDLFSPTEGAEVYALTKGEIIKVNRRQPLGDRPVEDGCSSIQFLSTTDSFYYWYGHLMDVPVETGDTVEAGQLIGYLATDKEKGGRFTANCWGGGPHLHIDRGCITAEGPQRGGSKSCRDPAFREDLRAIYDQLER